MTKQKEQYQKGDFLYNSRPEIIGQKIKFHCGNITIIDEENNKMPELEKVYADGVIESEWYDTMNGRQWITIHFPQYKKWKKYSVTAHMKMQINAVEFESGFKLN